MKKYLIALVAFAMVAASCRKNEDVTQVDIQTPPSQETEVLDALGLVTDEYGNPIAETTVELFDREGRQMGTTTTDDEGRFEIRNLQATADRMLVYAEKESYASAAQLLKAEVNELADIHLQMASSASFGQSLSLDPSDSTLIALTGKVVDDNGQGVTALVAVIQDGQPYHLVISGNNGSFQALVQPGLPVNLIITDYCANQLASQDIGPFDTDQVLDEISVPGSPTFTISGVLLDCDGNPVTNGYVLIDWSPNVTTSVDTDSDGAFSLQIQNCTNVKQTITLTGYDLSNDNVSELVTVLNNGDDLSAGQITVCLPDESRISFALNGDEYSFEPFTAFVVEDSITDPVSGNTSLGEVTIMIYQSEDAQDRFIMDVAGAETGTFWVRNLAIIIDGQTYVPICSEPQCNSVETTFTVHDKIVGDLIEGTFAGDFLTFNGNNTLSGNFKARLQE